jgi:thiol-disulfide isomerase/thioredoxin
MASPARSGDIAAKAGTTSPAASADQAEKAAFSRVTTKIFSADEALADHKVVDFSALREAMDQYWKEYPNAWRSPVNFYMDVFAKAHPDRVAAEWASFSNCVNAEVARVAQAEVRFIELSRQSFDFAFTALDGRRVDLKQLRGKVVLIDFWATWCAPCVEQIPMLQALYRQYHDQGLEIVGVSLDRAEDRAKLLDLVAKRGLPWPQYFDGKVWQSELAARYGVSAAPTTFLLDRAGKLAGINVDKNLPAEVRRLLGNPPVTPE